MIHVAESAVDKIAEIRNHESLGDDFFVRVSVTSGGCSGLSYKMDFDNEVYQFPILLKVNKIREKY